MAIVNAWILYREFTKKDITRSNFLLELIDVVRHKQIKSSSKIPTAACNQLTTRKRKKCRGSNGCANAIVSL